MKSARLNNTADFCKNQFYGLCARYVYALLALMSVIMSEIYYGLDRVRTMRCLSSLEYSVKRFLHPCSVHTYPEAWISDTGMFLRLCDLTIRKHTPINLRSCVFVLMNV